MEFRVLGPLEVAEHSRPLALGALKQRSLLAVLLLHANEVVPVERLVDELWGESPPATVGKSVQVYVSRLRKQLGDDRLVTRTPGYLLRVDPSELDLARFEAMVARAARAEPGTAAVQLRAALALWRGPPLADLAYEPFAQAQIMRLEELRVLALEQLIEAELASGRHAELVGELEALIAEHPLRERLRGQLMVALYRCGRQAEALDAFLDARTALTEQLGIEPSRALRQLQEAILRQDADLDGAPVAARAGGAAEQDREGVFVGRGRELSRLGAALDDALAGRGRLVLIAGEPGIGKSRLAEELIARARAHDARVLVGRCWEAGGAPAFWPWLQSLRAYVREAEPAALRAQLATGGAAVAELLPELRELVPQPSDPPPVEPEGARFRLFEAVSSLIQSAADARPVVLAIDDLHAADEPSLLLLRFVAREIATSRVLLLCAFRDVDPSLRDPLVSTVAELVREPHTLQIGLQGLSRADVAEYIVRSTGIAPAPPLVQAIRAETEGNPLFVGEVVRLLDGEGGIAEADPELRIPPGVRAVIGRRTRRLSERCRDVLVAAAVLGREFGLEPLALLCEIGADELLEPLDEAMTERLVGDVPGAPGRLRFAHALFRDALYDELTPARRLRLHQRAGTALEAVYAADPEPHLAELARHFIAAAPAGAADKAIDYARRAGDRAAAQLAYEEAARHYETALSLVDEPGARCELLLALGGVLARAGDTPASKRAHRAAADLAERVGRPEQLARAALGYGGRMMWEVARDDEQMVPLLERAIDALGDDDSTLRVRLLARLAGGPLRDSSFPPGRRAALSAQSLEMARRLGDPPTLAYAIHGYILGHHSPDHTRRQLELATEMVDVAARAGDTERVLEGHEERLVSRLELGDAAAWMDLEAMARLADELRQPSHDWLVAIYRTLRSLLEGRFADAEQLLEATRALGERVHRWSATVSYRLQLYVLRRVQGRLDEVADLVRRSAGEYPTYPIWRCVLAQTAAGLGDTDAARGELESLAEGGFSALPRDEEWLLGLSLLAETATTLADAERASTLYELLLPYRGRVAVSYPEISIGAAARCLGLLATTTERWDDAERDFQEALELNRRIGARPWVAQTRHDHARMLFARGRREDGVRARALRDAAGAGFRELGMPEAP